MNEKKTFVGNGKIVTSWKRGISVCLDDLQNHATQAKNGKFYVNLNVEDLKEKNQYGKDVSVSIDTWKPNQPRTEQPRGQGSTQGQKASNPKVVAPEDFVDDSFDIPF